ncbi:MAG: protein kinase domain-containing protein [Pseudoalteromonas sp.]|uniref:serine/threonine-protein kinase n=1 Tax=Pseudoalteromonas sp. TaxID=53249 RepID=UPI00384C42FE
MKGPDKIDDVLAKRYQIKGFLGEGGMQFVYLAFDKTLKRDIALKTPKNATASKRFKRSAVVAARVNHPNVAKTLDYFEDKGREYLVEELIDGQDMSQCIFQHVNYLDPFLVAKIFHRLSRGILASHHAGVVHRDLKPSNIMVAGGFNISEIKITDFGIAKMAEEEMREAAEGGSDTISASATAVGALPYMAPEAINTPESVGLGADIWSLGAMMFELLTGQKPFGNGLKAVNLIVQGKYSAIPNFVLSNPQFDYLSGQLISLIKKCLSLNPLERPNAEELSNECANLCYPISNRFIGTINEIRFNSFGFITLDYHPDVFFHMTSVYGPRPVIGDKVLLSKFHGGGADRALPVLRIN